MNKIAKITMILYILIYIGGLIKRLIASIDPCNTSSLEANFAYSFVPFLVSFVRYAVSEGSFRQTEALHFDSIHTLIKR